MDVCLSSLQVLPEVSRSSLSKVHQDSPHLVQADVVTSVQFVKGL